MKINFRRTVFIPVNMDTVWNAMTTHDFERDFFPEISRKLSAKPMVTEMDVVRSILWTAGKGVEIELTRKDLNVVIDSVELKLEPRGGGVDATICVIYSKQFVKHLIKAHRAVRNLFTTKLHVLKADCIGCAFKPGSIAAANLG